MKKFFLIFLMVFPVLSVAENTVIEPGDLVRISVYGNPDLTSETKVSAIGTINFPLLGEVEIGGMSVKAAKEFLSYRLTDEGFLRKAKVNLVILQSANKNISVLGSVLKPGKYQLEPGSEKLLDVIALSGGVSQTGSQVITVIRMNQKPPARISVDLDAMLKTSEVSEISKSNFKLEANDIIYVPKALVFYIYGEVNRPGSYPVESGMVVMQALALSGGISVRGSEGNVIIKRKSSDGTFKELDAKATTSIMANDIIFVEESLF